MVESAFREEEILLIRVFQLVTFSEEKRFFASLRMTFHVPPFSFRRVTEEKSNGRIVTLNGVKGLSMS